MECEEVGSNAHPMLLGSQYDYSQSLLHKLPTHSEAFDDWLKLLELEGPKLDYQTECELIAQSIRNASPREDQLINMDDLHQSKGVKPLLVLREAVKEQLRLLALNNLSDRRQLLLVVRGYIQQDKLRVINLEQRILELWKGNSKTELATIYSWFADFLFLESPETVVLLVGYMADQRPELLRKIELGSSTVADRVLQTHSGFKLQSEKQRNVFKWLFRHCSATVKATVFPYYVKMLTGNNALSYVVELMALGVTSIPREVAPIAKQTLPAMLQLSTNSPKLEGLVFEVLRGLVLLDGDIHTQAAKFLIERYHSRKAQFNRTVLEFISECLNSRSNVFLSEYLQVLLIEVRRHLVEDEPSQMKVSVEVLLKLIESQRLQLQQIKEICSSVLTIIQFRQSGLVTLHCMAVLQGMLLVDSSTTCELLKELNKEQDFLGLLTNDAYCRSFIEKHLNPHTLEPYRRLYILAAAKVLQWPLSQDQFMPIWEELLNHCKSMALAPKTYLIDIHERPKLDRKLFELPEAATSPPPASIVEVGCLQNLKILQKDEFAQIYGIVPVLRQRFNIEFSFHNYHRIFHEGSSTVRQVVRLKHQ